MLDALVIGGGPAGSTIAALLAGSGWKVGLAEAAAFPRRKVCGEYLSPTNYPLFRLLGFEERFLELAGPEIRRVGIFSGDIELISPFPKNEKLPRPWGRALRREVLDVELLNLALGKGIQLWQPYSAVRVERHSDSFVTSLKAGNSESVDVRSRLVIAAHGSWKIGPLPTQQKRQPPSPHDLFGFKAHFKNTQLPPDLMPMIVFPGGYGGLVTTDKGFMSISACVERSTLERLRKDSPSKELGPLFEQHLLANVTPLRSILEGSKRVGKWLTAGVVAPGSHTRSRDGILAVGNLIDALRGNLPPRESADPRAVLLILAGLALLIAIIGLGGGFILATTALFVTTSTAFGRRAILADLAIAVVMTTLIYLAFDRLLTLSLPAGPLERLL